MNLKLNILGFDIATLSLDQGERSSLPEPEPSALGDLVGKAVKSATWTWVKRAVK